MYSDWSPSHSTLFIAYRYIINSEVIPQLTSNPCTISTLSSMYCPGTSVWDAGECVCTGVEEEELFSSFEGVDTADAVSFVFDGVVDSFVDFDFDIDGLARLIKNKLTLVTLRYKG